MLFFFKRISHRQFLRKIRVIRFAIYWVKYLVVELEMMKILDLSPGFWESLGTVVASAELSRSKMTQLMKCLREPKKLCPEKYFFLSWNGIVKSNCSEVFQWQNLEGLISKKVFDLIQSSLQLICSWLCLKLDSHNGINLY